MRLYKPDCYAILTIEGERIDLSPVNAESQRRLDMAFNCFLTETSEPNSGRCVIFNLSETTRNKISKKGRIEIYAGYDNNYKLISIGDIVVANNRKPDTDWQTAIEWGDGIGTYSAANFRKSYREGIGVKDIFADLFSTLGLAVNSITDELEDVTNGGLSLNGKAKDLLDKLAKDYGLTWSIQDEEIRVVREGQPIDNQAIVISPETGLLESPQVSEKGIDFVAQLNPDLRPNKLVDIRSQSLTIIRAPSQTDTGPTEKQEGGINIIESVRFMGDNFGGEFAAHCVCKAFNQ